MISLSMLKRSVNVHVHSLRLSLYHVIKEATRHFDVSELNDCCSCFLITRNHLSFSFSFFIHGESSVCTAVEIQRQQRVRHLTLEDVAVAATRQEGLPGIASGKVLSAI